MPATPIDPPIDPRGERPTLGARVIAAHDAAVARGEDGYEDPDTGMFVFTSTALARFGRCCGSGCRHCPYRAGGPLG